MGDYPVAALASETAVDHVNTLDEEQRGVHMQAAACSRLHGNFGFRPQRQSGHRIERGSRLFLPWLLRLV